MKKAFEVGIDLGIFQKSKTNVGPRILKLFKGNCILEFFTTKER